MEEKNSAKISLSTFFLILAIIAIIVMGIFIYKLNNDKTAEVQKSTELQTQVNNLNGTIDDLQGKIDTISKTINSNSFVEYIPTDNNSNNTSFTDEQVKVTLTNYLELMAQQDGQEILQLLTQKGKLNFKNSDVKILNNGTVVTNVKFTDYKNAMLNFVSETEFEKNWNSKWFNQNSDGYVTTIQGGGTIPVYTINSINKISDSNYTAQTSYIIDESEPTPSYDKTFTFVITSSNNNCVIDSIK